MNLKISSAERGDRRVRWSYRRAIEDAHHLKILLQWVSRNSGSFTLSRRDTKVWHLKVIHKDPWHPVFEQSSKNLSLLVGKAATQVRKLEDRLEKARVDGL